MPSSDIYSLMVEFHGSTDYLVCWGCYDNFKSVMDSWADWKRSTSNQIDGVPSGVESMITIHGFRDNYARSHREIMFDFNDVRYMSIELIYGGTSKLS